jgi:hypothetical protein
MHTPAGPGRRRGMLSVQCMDLISGRRRHAALERPLERVGPVATRQPRRDGAGAPGRHRPLGAARVAELGAGWTVNEIPSRRPRPWPLLFVGSALGGRDRADQSPASSPLRVRARRPPDGRRRAARRHRRDVRRSRGTEGMPQPHARCAGPVQACYSIAAYCKHQACRHERESCADGGVVISGVAQLAF